MPDDQKKPDLVNRWLAAKALREALYVERPVTHAVTDIIEDLPGSFAKAVAPSFNDVLPSLAIISRDPVKRKAQIAKAVAEVRHHSQSEEHPARKAIANALKMGLTTLPVALSFSGLGKRLNTGNFKFLKDRHYWATALADAGVGATVAGAYGAAVPILAKARKFSDEDLAVAANLIDKHPYLTSLPAAEAVGLNPDKSYASAISTGAGIGALGGATGALLTSALSVPYEKLTAHLLGVEHAVAAGLTPKRLGVFTVGGAAAGALIGALIKHVADKDNRKKDEKKKKTTSFV